MTKDKTTARKKATLLEEYREDIGASFIGLHDLENYRRIVQRALDEPQ